MVKIFKNNVLNIFILVAFFLSQVVSVHANYLRSNHQPDSFVSVMEEEKNNAINMVTFHLPDFTHEAKNENALEEKFEKVVFEPITLGLFTTVGAFSFGALTGSVMAIFSAIIGWAIGKTQAT
ncbi:hypothetical protein [Bartonella phoceensis]|uniref:hypothetical protein n=1 Tax=Bartonella phoceensis TaxID=270249 RepID=UPI001ABAC14E|nr:hypothetical protein [Bartonella phoceensis]